MRKLRWCVTAALVVGLVSACVGTSSSARGDGGAVLVTAPPSGSARGDVHEILTLGDLSEHARVPGPVRELLAEKAVSLPEERARYDSQVQAPSVDVMGVVRYFVLLPDPKSGEYHFDLVDGDRLDVELMLANASLADLKLTLMCVVDLVRLIDCGSSAVELQSGTGTIVPLELGGIDDGARIDVFVISSGDLERIFPASGHVRVFAGGDPDDERAHLRALAHRAGFSLGEPGDFYDGCAFGAIADSRRLGDASIAQSGARASRLGEQPVLVVDLCEDYESVLTVPFLIVNKSALLVPAEPRYGDGTTSWMMPVPLPGSTSDIEELQVVTVVVDDDGAVVDWWDRPRRP